MYRISKNLFLFIFVLLLVIKFGKISPKASETEKNVLIINSYYSGYDWTDEQCQGILNTLNNDNDIIKYVEYMDWKRDTTNGNLNNLYNYYKYKYSEKKIDLIITTDDAALSFAIKYRIDLFSNAPIVFEGVDKNSENAILEDVSNVTGIYESIDPEGTISEALKIMPKTQDIYVVHDNTETGISYYNLADTFVYSNNINVKLHDLGNYPIDEICKITKELPDDSVVLLDAYRAEYSGFSLPLKNFQIE